MNLKQLCYTFFFIRLFQILSRYKNEKLLTIFNKYLVFYEIDILVLLTFVVYLLKIDKLLRKCIKLLTFNISKF